VTIKERITYVFQCELCTYASEGASTMAYALMAEDDHLAIAHPSFVAERERRRAAAAPATEPLHVVESDGEEA